MSDLHEPVLQWYDAHARDLPWRAPEATPWGILVSEFMLQQTPVVRVLPVWTTWLATWPTPADLAAQPAGEAVRAWGRLGYPRRALRLHAAAQAIVERHHGQVPASYDALKALPGVGDYTAAAVSSFAYRQRHVVLDTNVRRVLARSVSGVEFPPTAVTRAERELATGLLPDEQAVAANWAVAVMELGALVCTARSPQCGVCPLARLCAWRLSGYPAYEGPTRAVQRFAGTDRQVRGLLMAVLRDSPVPVPQPRLDTVWPDAAQRGRALDSLIADGLVDPLPDGTYALPGGLQLE
jgi:A/G-specific adenine glycosylase